MTDIPDSFVVRRARALFDRVEWRDPDIRAQEAQALLIAGYQLLRRDVGQDAANAAVHGLIAAAELSGEAVDA